MLVLKVGAQELEAELEWGVELHDLSFNAVMISSVHVLDVITAYRVKESLITAIHCYLTKWTHFISYNICSEL